MRISLFDNMNLCSDAEVTRMLPLVSDQRREQALKYKFTSGRFLCLKSALMLQDALARMNVISSGETLTFEYGKYNKPVIAEHPDIHFNISHCPAGIAVAIDTTPVGIDIEIFHHADRDLLLKTMNEEERCAIRLSKNPDETFTKYWTQKEALLKFRGTGITDDFVDALRCSDPVVIQTHVNPEHRYVWSVCGLSTPHLVK